MLRLGWFSTGRDEAARNLLAMVMKKKDRRFFDITIPFVFCNWEEGEEPEHPDFAEREKFFALVHSYDVPLVTLSWKKFMPQLRQEDGKRWRTEYGKALMEVVRPYPMEVGILAGYMLWVDDETCAAYNLINLHPALPDGPRGTWQEVIWQLIEHRADHQGAMLHLCTRDWDKGPALTYCRFSIKGPRYEYLWRQMDWKLRSRTLNLIKEEEGESEPLFRQIRNDGEVRELPLLAHSIKLLADGKVHIKDEFLYQDGQRLEKPYDLTRDVERALLMGEFREG